MKINCKKVVAKFFATRKKKRERERKGKLLSGEKRIQIKRKKGKKKGEKDKKRAGSKRLAAYTITQKYKRGGKGGRKINSILRRKHEFGERTIS